MALRIVLKVMTRTVVLGKAGWSAEDFRRYAFRCADIEARSYRRKCHRAGKRIVYLAPDVIQAFGNETQELAAAIPLGEFNPSKL